MTIRYRNRKGDFYYLHEGRTKTGKPRYFFSRKAEGNLADGIPEGYEPYEKPDTTQVYLRKVQSTAITEEEREFVQAECRRLSNTQAILVDVEKDSLVVYFAKGNDWLLGEVFRGLGIPSQAAQKAAEWRVTHGNYQKMLRFTLQDQDRRLFSVDRWCSRGSIDKWFALMRPMPLERAVREYAQHLGRESFFDLM